MNFNTKTSLKFKVVNLKHLRQEGGKQESTHFDQRITPDKSASGVERWPL